MFNCNQPLKICTMLDDDGFCHQHKYSKCDYRSPQTEHAKGSAGFTGSVASGDRDKIVICDVCGGCGIVYADQYDGDGKECDKCGGKGDL